MPIKSLPNNIEAEESVLGACFLSKYALQKACENLTPDSFYDEKNGKIFAAMSALVEEKTPIDITTVTGYLKKNNQLTEIGGVEYLTEVVNFVPTASNIDYYIKNVEDASILRNLIELWYLDLFIFLITLVTGNISLILMIFLNFQIFFSYIFFLHYSTSSNELRKTFLCVFKPLEKLKINPYKLSDFLVNVINFFPEYNRNVKKIYKNEKNRGAVLSSAPLIKKIKIVCSVYKKALSLYSLNYYKKNKMKEYMLFDEHKKIKRIKSAVGFRDFLFVLIHILIIVFLFFQEEVYYEIFVKFLVQW